MHEEQRGSRKSGRPIPPAPLEQQQLDPMFFRGGGGSNKNNSHTRWHTKDRHSAHSTAQAPDDKSNEGNRHKADHWLGGGHSPCMRSKEYAERVVGPSPRPRSNNNNFSYIFSGGGARTTTTTRTRGGTQRTDIEPPPLLMDRMTTTRRVTSTRQTNVLEVGTATRGTRRG